MRPHPYTSARRLARYLPNVLRLAAFAATVSVVLGVVTVRAAAQNVREGMLSLGREMMRFADGRAMTPVRTLALNGARVEFATGSTTESVTRVLDWYQARCAQHSGGMDRVLDAVRERLPTPLRPDAEGMAQRASTLREGTDRAGFVACLDLGTAQTVTPEEILRRVSTFTRTGNLADVGGLRYLYAERTASGGTHMVGFWSDGEVNVTRMFPSTGDAPGDDPEDVGRPPVGMRRVLSAREEGEPYGMTVYAGNTPRPQVESHYREAFQRAGWSLVPAAPHDPSAGDPDLGGQTLLAFERGPTSAFVVVGENPDHLVQASVLLAR